MVCIFIAKKQNSVNETRWSLKEYHSPTAASHLLCPGECYEDQLKSEQCVHIIRNNYHVIHQLCGIFWDNDSLEKDII